MTISLYGASPPVHDLEQLRDAMVDIQLHDVHDTRVLDAMRLVPRHLFAPLDCHARAYDDVAIPIGYGKSLPEPRIIAAVLQAADLRGTERVLEVGVTSGYETALLQLLASEVYTLEVIPALARVARENLHHASCHTAHFRHGEAALGWPESAPYDVIVLSGAVSSVPDPLLEQLARFGRAVLPVGPGPVRLVRRITRARSRLESVDIAIPDAPRSWGEAVQ